MIDDPKDLSRTSSLLRTLEKLEGHTSSTSELVRVALYLIRCAATVLCIFIHSNNLYIPTTFRPTIQQHGFHYSVGVGYKARTLSVVNKKATRRLVVIWVQSRIFRESFHNASMGQLRAEFLS